MLRAGRWRAGKRAGLDPLERWPQTNWLGWWKSGAVHILAWSEVKWREVKVAQLCLTFFDPMDSSPWNSPGQNTRAGSLSLLQGIFPTQGLNPGLPRGRWILYQPNHQGSPRILGWVAYSFSSGSSQCRNRTGVSCIAGGFFTSWDTRESLIPLQKPNLQITLDYFGVLQSNIGFAVTHEFYV